MSFQTILNDDPRINYSTDPPWDSRGSTSRQWATANYTFDNAQGMIFKVYGTGTVSPKGNTPSAFFSLDTCEPPIRQWSLDTTSLHEQLMYDCVIRGGGEHSLKINVTSASPNRMFSLHKIELSSEPVITTSTTPEMQGYGTGSASPPTSSSSQSSSDSSHSTNVGGIVGGVIAALVVLASLIAFILYRKRQLERRRHITPFMASTMSDVPDTPLPTHAAIPSSPPRIHSPPIERDRSPAILEDELPPFVAGNSRDIARHGSMYKPRRSVESLPPTEYGYGGGLREWSSENRQSPLR